ncbi:MAG: riboflavin biosynthesis protein RibF [Erysipelothrix sp.]|nr:riboflavin biosynthesis protein RibF [Erysipelothrix sp.]
MKRTMITNISQITFGKDKVVACIGFFDGLHKGHQVLINKTIERAKSLGIPSMLITFNPDPWAVLNKKSNVKHITPLKTKLEVIETFGIDEVVVLKFDSNLSSLSPDDFIFKVLMGLGVTELVVGQDFKFGFRGQGNVELLINDYAEVIKTHVMGIKLDDKTKIGSTQVTQTILNGNLEKTSELLGRDYRISGIVIDGAKQGTEIGFPTANLDIYDEFVLPKVGVYAGYTYVNDIKYMSIINIGYNPTFNTKETVSVETHILDFNRMIYGEVIHQDFTFRIRDELKFETIDQLIDQMKNDEKIARAQLKLD